MEKPRELDVPPFSFDSAAGDGGVEVLQAMLVSRGRACEYGTLKAVTGDGFKFLYDHDGGSDQTAEKYVKYVDQLNSPWIGMQFDIGNHWKYGNPGDWIRDLGRRIVKLDVKGFSRKSNSFTNIGAGDLPWSDVRQALRDINYTGWVAAEVNGGNFQRLNEISANMDRVFDL